MQGEVVQRSYLSWLYASLGPTYLLLLLLAAAVGAVVILLVLVKGRGPLAPAALLLAVLLPIFVGAYSAVDGMLNSYTLMATSAATPKPSEIAEGISTALFGSLVGLLLAAPLMALALVGSLIRSLFDPQNDRTPVGKS